MTTVSKENEAYFSEQVYVVYVVAEPGDADGALAPTFAGALNAVKTYADNMPQFVSVRVQVVDVGEAVDAILTGVERIG